MAIPTFPVLPGLSFPVFRKPSFATIEHKAVAGNSTTQSPQAYPLYSYELPFEFLRADNFTLEVQTLMSFYTSRKGKALPFHFSDPDDNAVVGQVIGIGDGATTDFGFVRTMVSAIDPLQDVTFATVYNNGVPQVFGVDFNNLYTTQYLTNYGIRFAVAPAAGRVITSDIIYKWLCRFDEDQAEFAMLQYLNGKGLWEAKAIKFSSVLQ